MPAKKKNATPKTDAAVPVAKEEKVASPTASKGGEQNGKGQAGKGKAATGKVESVDELKDKGNAAFGKHQYAEAIEFFNRGLAIEPNHRALLSNRAASFQALKQYQKALEDAEAVIGVDPAWAKGYFRKGQALEGLLQYPEAYRAYLAGLEKEPKDEPLQKAAAEMKSVIEELAMGAQESKEANPDADKFTTMCHWLKDGGSLFPKLYLRYYDEDYRGVHCLTKVPAEDVILYVPLKQIMTSEVAKASDIGKKIIASGVDIRSKHSYLAAYLLQERAKGKKSFWEPYLRILPEKYANMPIYFDEEMLGELKGSMTLQKIADRIESLRREYEAIRRVVPDFNKFTLDDFIWARLVVITRIFGLEIDGNKTDGLVPYADMLNHKKPNETGGKDESETRWTYDNSRNGFIITTVRSIARGEQVFDSYGRKCNSRFFVNYGFTMEDNAEDNESMFRVVLPATDARYSMKLRMLGNHERCARREFQVPANYREKKTKELFSFMRFIHAQDSEMLVFSQSEGFKLDDIEPISVRNELRVLADIKAACETRLGHFPTTLEEDKKMLADEEKYPRFSNLRNCVTMRKGEKEILHWFIDLADRATPLLKMSWKDLKKIATKANQSNLPADFYIANVVSALVKKNN